MADTETGNLQVVHSSPEITLMMWGNLTKNPRFKTFKFEDEKQGFELPKQLALSDIAIRMIKTKFDHYSHHCKTYKLKKKKPPAVIEEVHVEPKTEEETKEEITDPVEEAEKNSEETGDQEKLENDESTEEEEKKDDTEKQEEETKVEQPEDAVEEEEEEDGWEEEEDDEDAVILRAYQVLGGVITFDILSLPPQPKTVKSWVMTQVASDELKFVEYPASSESKLNVTLSGTLPMGQTLDSKAIATAAAAAETLGAPPIGVTLSLPDDVLYSEEPQMAYWCPERKQWRLDGFVDIKYEEEMRILSFKTINSGPFACIQDRHINMPFQKWEIHPIELNHAKLIIIAAIIEVEIEIKGEFCCFRQTQDSEPNPELESVQNKWMAPQQLIKTLFNVGVNLFPEADSKKYVSIQEKDSDNEFATYRQMALTASHFAYAWSRWNSEAGKDKIILQGCEQLDEFTPPHDKWSVLMMSSHRAMKLRISEEDDEFSEDFAEGTQFHADLYHMVCDLSTDEGLEKMRQSDFMFIDAVSQLLKATKLLTYA